MLARTRTASGGPRWLIEAVELGFGRAGGSVRGLGDAAPESSRQGRNAP